MTSRLKLAPTLPGPNILTTRPDQTGPAAAALQISTPSSEPEFKINIEKMAETDLENQTKAQNGKSPEASPEKKER